MAESLDKSQYLFDDFSEDFDVSKKWIRSHPSQGIVSGGQLHLVPTTGYYYMQSWDDWDFRDSYVSFKLVQNCNAENSVGTTFAVGPSWPDCFEIELDGGGAGAALKFQELVNYDYDITEITYDPAVHVWFRIRSNNTVVYWETSPDGDTWTIHKSVPSVIPLDACAIRFTAYHWDTSIGDPGESIVDDFNLFAGPPGRPKAHTLVDAFNQETELWDYESSNNNKVVGGRLEMISTAVDFNYSPLYAKGTYDLTDSYFGIQLVQPTEEGNGSFINDIFVGTSHENCVNIRFGAYQSWMRFGEIIDGVGTYQSFGIQLDPDRHKYLRIRESGGTVYYETSIDGEYWTIRHSKVYSIDLTECRIRLYSAPYEEEVPSKIIYDNANTFGVGTFGPDVPFKAHLLKEDFTTDKGNWWGSEGVVLQDGALHIDVVEEYQYATLAGYWDLRESSAMWQMVQNALPGTSGWDGKGTTGTNLVVTVGPGVDDNSVRFIIYGGDTGTVQCETRLGGVRTKTDFTYNKFEDKYFRIRESGGITYWETSPNSLTWSIKKQEDTGLNYYSCQFGFAIGYWDSENEFGPNGTVILDNFNVYDYTLQNAIAWGRNDLALGGRKTGTVQPRLFFEEAAWLWDPIPENPVLDPLSEQIANSALHDPTISPPVLHGTSPMAYGNALIHPNMIKPDTPRYFMYMDVVDVGVPWHYDDPYDPEGLYDHPFPEYGTTLPGIPIPYGTRVPPGSDCHLTVADPVTQKVFSFWQVRYKPETDQWRCTYGGIADLHGDGRDYAGSATATNISRYACQATIAELAAGEIPHALFVVSNACTDWVRGPTGNWIGEGAAGTRYPAQKSDGHNYANAAYTIDQGARLQLDPSIDLTQYGLSQAELAVGRCWQRYGAYVLDSGGRSYPPGVSGASISELYQDYDYPLFPFGEWGEEIFNWGYDLDEFEFELDSTPIPPIYYNLGIKWDYYAFTKIPWAGNIRVLKHWHGGDTL